MSANPLSIQILENHRKELLAIQRRCDKDDPTWERLRVRILEADTALDKLKNPGA